VIVSLKHFKFNLSLLADHLSHHRGPLVVRGLQVEKRCFRGFMGCKDKYKLGVVCGCVVGGGSIQTIHRWMMN
jgi:hypothetical protein